MHNPNYQHTFAALLRKEDSLAQLVEHNTFNVGVLGSSPKRITKAKVSKSNSFADFFVLNNIALKLISNPAKFYSFLNCALPVGKPNNRILGVKNE